MIVKFYKGVLVSDISIKKYIPGSVTTDIKEALMWAERINSSKKKGAAKHVRHGKSCIIEFSYDTSNFLDEKEFQASGIKEHERRNCWMNTVRSKAQINTPVEVSVTNYENLCNMTII